jgi:eukaryotic-like serine/threonine-protein kinase
MLPTGVTVGAMASELESLIGAVLSKRYRLVRLLGEGGMGAVFEALDQGDGNKYAVKLLHPEYAHSPEIVQRLYAEAQAAQRLSHPNIVRYFGFAQAEDGSPYVVMEFLDGAPLSDYLKGGTAYEVGFAVAVARAVLSALSLAHRQGVVHRDLKPENIFLVHGVGPPTPKVLDFGIAKMMDAAGGMMSKTRTGMLLGTPGYMSPEQIKSAKHVDARADLWSVGVVLYELMTGRQTFPAPSEMAKLTAILTQDPVPIDQERPHLAPWRGFFARALAKEPDWRFSTADEMYRAIDAILGPAQRGASGPRSIPNPLAATTPTRDSPLLAVPHASTDPSRSSGVGPTQMGEVSGHDTLQSAVNPAQRQRMSSQPGPIVSGPAPLPFATPAPYAAPVAALPLAEAAVPAPPAVPSAPYLPVASSAAEMSAAPRRMLPTPVPSEIALPGMPQKAGVALGVVILLVAVAVALGFAAGFLVARL